MAWSQQHNNNITIGLSDQDRGSKVYDIVLDYNQQGLCDLLYQNNIERKELLNVGN